MGMSQRTLQRWIATGPIPYSHRKRPRARLIDPYKTYLLKRGPQGCHTGAQKDQRTARKRIQRVATRDLSVPADVESLEACSLDPAQSTLDALGITDHLALFPEARGFTARRTGDPVPV